MFHQHSSLSQRIQESIIRFLFFTDFHFESADIRSAESGEYQLFRESPSLTQALNSHREKPAAF
jgi:hypothetical protein